MRLYLLQYTNRSHPHLVDYLQLNDVPGGPPKWTTWVQHWQDATPITKDEADEFLGYRGDIVEPLFRIALVQIEPQKETP